MRQMHSPMRAWACINAILEFAGQPDVLFGELHAIIGDDHTVDPVEAAKRIIAARQRRGIDAPAPDDRAQADSYARTQAGSGP